MRSLLLLGALALAFALVPAVGAVEVPSAEQIVQAAVQAGEDPGSTVQDPQAVLQPVLEDPKQKPAPPGGDAPGFAERIGEAFEDHLFVVGVAGTVVAGAALLGFALVTRYVSPKEALSNPQRAMLYGYVRGHPGVHLKQLSEEFAMKTSSILWHVRKLEAAELVHSDRANGFRVFYPVAGGIEIKRVSRAITALHNGNAERIYETVERRAGASVRDVAERLGMHGGTVRWHLRKLREFGLVEELVRDDGSRFFPTPLGRKALETLKGSPVAPAVPAPAVPAAFRTPSGVPVPLE